MSSISTTRGMSFNPAEAARQREQAAAERAEQDKADHVASMREFGRFLDQVETCYKAHQPPQIRFRAEMETCDPNGDFDPHIGDCRYL